RIDLTRHRQRRGRPGGDRASSSTLPPDERLRHAVRRAPTRRANPLIVLGLLPWNVVSVTELSFDLDQVLDVPPGTERVPASSAMRRLAFAAGGLVEAHPQLRRALDDVEELAEGQPGERTDDGDRVQDRDEGVGITAHPCVADGEH